MIRNPKDATNYLATVVVNEFSTVKPDQDRVKRILRRRGFDTGEWNRIIVSSSKKPSYEIPVSWEGSFLGTLVKTDTGVIFDPEEPTLH